MLLSMKILGIDPGLATIGFAVLDDGVLRDYGVVTTPAGDELPQRLQEIYTNFSDLIAEVQPDVVAVEQLFFVQNVTNGIAVAHARGVTLLACLGSGARLLEVAPKQVKTAVCGNGNAPKQQVQAAVQQIFQLPAPPRPDDAADAIAIAFWASCQ